MQSNVAGVPERGNLDTEVFIEGGCQVNIKMIICKTKKKEQSSLTAPQKGPILPTP